MNLERELKAFVRQIRPGLIGATSNPNVNLTQVIADLQTSPKWNEDLKKALVERVISRDFVAALTETGLTLESGVFSEIFQRLEYKLLPKRAAGEDVLGFLRTIFDSSGDVGWLESIDRERFAELLGRLLPDPGELIEPLAPQLFMSLEILSLRLAGLGYDPLVTQRLNSRKDLQHSFMDVTRDVHTLLDKGESAIPGLKASLARADKAAAYVRSRRAVEGVSVSLSYRLMKIQQVVRRAELVVLTIETMLGEWRPGPSRDLFFEIILAELKQFKLRDFFRSNFELLAFQITEHTGKAGEHYIARTRQQWFGMLESAMIGGMVVAGIAVVKILASKLHLPAGPEALVYGAIYAGGFLLIHAIGGTLATKQPAMTASTLAAGPRPGGFDRSRSAEFGRGGVSHGAHPVGGVARKLPAGVSGGGGGVLAVALLRSSVDGSAQIPSHPRVPQRLRKSVVRVRRDRGGVPVPQRDLGGHRRQLVRVQSRRRAVEAVRIAPPGGGGDRTRTRHPFDQPQSGILGGQRQSGLHARVDGGARHRDRIAARHSSHHVCLGAIRGGGGPV